MKTFAFFLSIYFATVAGALFVKNAYGADQIDVASGVLLLVDGLHDSVILTSRDGATAVIQLGQVPYDEQPELYRVLNELREYGALIEYDMQTPCGVGGGRKGGVGDE